MLAEKIPVPGNVSRGHDKETPSMLIQSHQTFGTIEGVSLGPGGRSCCVNHVARVCEDSLINVVVFGGERGPSYSVCSPVEFIDVQAFQNWVSRLLIQTNNVYTRKRQKSFVFVCFEPPVR